MAPGLDLPALRRDEQPLAASEAQRVLDTDRAVAQSSAQREQGGYLQRPERSIAVGVGDVLPPRRARTRRRDIDRQGLVAGRVLRAQGSLSKDVPFGGGLLSWDS